MLNFIVQHTVGLDQQRNAGLYTWLTSQAPLWLQRTKHGCLQRRLHHTWFQDNVLNCTECGEGISIQALSYSYVHYRFFFLNCFSIRRFYMNDFFFWCLKPYCISLNAFSLPLESLLFGQNLHVLRMCFIQFGMIWELKWVMLLQLSETWYVVV